MELESLELSAPFPLPGDSGINDSSSGDYLYTSIGNTQVNISSGGYNSSAGQLPSTSFVYTVVRHMGLCVVMNDYLQRVTSARAFVQVSLAVPGILGALLSLRVTCLRRNRSSLSVQVALLSFYDLLYLSAVLLLSVLHLATVANRVVNGLLLALRMISLWCVTYTLVDISVERCLAIDRPLYARKVCRVSFTLKRAAVILAAGLILTLPFVLDLIFGFSTKNDECQPRQLNRSERRLTDYGVVYTLHVVLILFFLFPFTVIIIVNSKLVYALAGVAKRHRAASGRGMTSPSSSAFSSSVRKGAAAAAGPKTAASQAETSAKQLSIFVVGMSLWYAACMLVPSLIFTVRLSRIELFRPQMELAVVAAVDCFIVASAAANFLFYFLFWRQFRITCLAVFCTGCRDGNGLDDSFYGQGSQHLSRSATSSAKAKDGAESSGGNKAIISDTDNFIES